MEQEAIVAGFKPTHILEHVVWPTVYGRRKDGKKGLVKADKPLIKRKLVQLLSPPFKSKHSSVRIRDSIGFVSTISATRLKPLDVAFEAP